MHYNKLPNLGVNHANFSNGPLPKIAKNPCYCTYMYLGLEQIHAFKPFILDILSSGLFILDRIGKVDLVTSTSDKSNFNATENIGGKHERRPSFIRSELKMFMDGHVCHIFNLCHF